MRFAYTWSALPTRMLPILLSKELAYYGEFTEDMLCNAGFEQAMRVLNVGCLVP